MQGENRYINLLRTSELAKRKNEPLVPFDKYELEMFSLHAARAHLPEVTQTPEEWNEFVRVAVNNQKEFETFVLGIKTAMEDPSKITLGVTTSNATKEFVVYIKNN